MSASLGRSCGQRRVVSIVLLRAKQINQRVLIAVLTMEFVNNGVCQ